MDKNISGKKNKDFGGRGSVEVSLRGDIRAKTKDMVEQAVLILGNSFRAEGRPWQRSL